MDINEKIKNLSIEEKIAFLRGKDSWNTVPLEKINLKSIRMSDGPHGLRKENLDSKNPMEGTYPAVCFPTASLSSCSFDRDLLYEIGRRIGKEARNQNVHIVLGPGVNIKRNPLCGRNFEYFSEDPYLAGELAIAFSKGVESNNVGVCVKHFAVNSEEKDRARINEVVDERALREIYLEAFRKCVEEANPASIMPSYNLVNGTYACENKYLLTDILRKEWNFKGITISDWGAVNDATLSIKNGLDLEMPNSSNVNYFKVLEDYRSGKISEEDINAPVFRCISLYEQLENNENEIADYASDHEFAVKAAEESIVLLKNDGKLLPLNENETILYVGEFINRTHYQGLGSSKINPYRLTGFIKELEKYSSHYQYARGYDSSSLSKSRGLIKEAVDLAKNKNKVVVFLGLTKEIESEGYDRKNASLPECQIELINEISKVNPNIIVVLENGSVVELPFINQIRGCIECYLGGEGINEAILRVLYGKVNPSGRLSETFFKILDNSVMKNYLTNNRFDNLHKESIFVGYRYYVSHPEEVLYPFGYGLSYSDITYSNFKIENEMLNENNEIRISFDLTNHSSIDAKEVVQVYIGKPNDVIFNPKRELKQFKKVEVKANSTINVEVTLPYKAFEYFDINVKKFIVQDAIYNVEVARNSLDVIERFRVKVNGVRMDYSDSPYYLKAQKYFKCDVKSITDNEFLELDHSLVIRKIDKANYKHDLNSSIDLAIEMGSKGAKLLKGILKSFSAIKNDKFIQEIAFSSPLRQIRYFANNFLNDEEIDLMLKIMNDEKYISNIFKFLINLTKKNK